MYIRKSCLCTNSCHIKYFKSYYRVQFPESTRLYFFRSILPKVDSLTEDEFLEFQVDVLRLLRIKSSSTATLQGQERYNYNSSHSPMESYSTFHLDPKPNSSIHRDTPTPTSSGSSHCWLSESIQITSRSILTFLRL